MYAYLSLTSDLNSTLVWPLSIWENLCWNLDKEWNTKQLIANFEAFDHHDHHVYAKKSTSKIEA